jgi:hypothetical protein
MESDQQRETRETNFTYHPPKPGQPELYTVIREKAKELSKLINDSCPPSRELSLAQTNLEQTVFWANAAIARHGADVVAQGAG